MPGITSTWNISISVTTPSPTLSFDLLAEKVKEGVEVRAMFDAFGNWSNNQPLKKRHLQAIKARGIEIIKFDPITFPYINHAMHRDHRKIVVIDGKDQAIQAG